MNEMNKFSVGQRVVVNRDAWSSPGDHGFITQIDFDDTGKDTRVWVAGTQMGFPLGYAPHELTLEEPAPQPVDQKNVQATLNERGKTHGDFFAQAATATNLQLVMRDASNFLALKPDQRQALEVICTKMSRILHGNPNEPDHWRDIAGYATLVENRLVHGKSHLG